MRRIITPILTAAFMTLGFWLGEGGLPPVSFVPVMAGALACLAVALALPGRSWLRLTGGGVALALYVAAFLGGSFSFERAFNECVVSGERVRARLDAWHRAHGHYPARLDRLEGGVPCGRILRPTILDYTPARDGYVLSFGDWLVEHTATETEPFTAHK